MNIDMMHEEGLRDMKVVIDVFNLWLINGLDQLYRFSEGSKEHLRLVILPLVNS